MCRSSTGAFNRLNRLYKDFVLVSAISQCRAFGLDTDVRLT